MTNNKHRNSGADKEDGFSNAMAKILQQQVPSKVPVLAKRKTPIMRELDAEVQQQQNAKKSRLQKQQEKEMHLVRPTPLQADYERQLRKLATKGVIALFNAISTAKKDLAVASADKKNEEVGVQEMSRAVGQLTRDNFLGLLKDDGAKKSVSKNKVDETPSGSNKGWKALADNYYEGDKFNLKNWDKDEEQSSEVDGSEEAY